MISFALVDIKSINSTIPRSSFSEVYLERLADLIIDCGGLVKPLVLKAIGPESYTVVDGDFEYYAAVRAREKDPRKGEMVNAFVVSPKNESIIIEQTTAIKSLTSPDDSTNFESHLTNIELRLEKQNNDLRAEWKQEIQRLEDKLKTFENLIPKKSNPLKCINILSQDELVIKLQRSRISGAEKIAKAIVDARRKKQNKKFEDYRDVVKSVKDLAEKRILTIIDDWSLR